MPDRRPTARRHGVALAALLAAVLLALAVVGRGHLDTSSDAPWPDVLSASGPPGSDPAGPSNTTGTTGTTGPATPPGTDVQTSPAPNPPGTTGGTRPPATRIDGCCGGDGCCLDAVEPRGYAVAVRTPDGRDRFFTVGPGGEAVSAWTTFEVDGLTVALLHVAAHRMAADGRLDLATPVSRWLPAVPGADAVTVGMLLDGTSGWSTAADPSALLRSGGRWSLPDIVAAAVRQPGDAGPASVGHPVVADLALQHVLEQVGGASLPEVLADEVVEPLGLRQTAPRGGSSLPADGEWTPVQVGGQRHDVTSFVDLLTLLEAEPGITGLSGPGIEARRRPDGRSVVIRPIGHDPSEATLVELADRLLGPVAPTTADGG